MALRHIIEVSYSFLQLKRGASFLFHPARQLDGTCHVFAQIGLIQQCRTHCGFFRWQVDDVGMAWPPILLPQQEILIWRQRCQFFFGLLGRQCGGVRLPKNQRSPLNRADCPPMPTSAVIPAACPASLQCKNP